MSKLWNVLLGVFLLSLNVWGDYVPNSDWENPGKLSVNRETSRAFFVPYATLDEALAGQDEKSSLVRSLNGQWKFNWVPEPNKRPADFYKPDFDVSGWKDIPVPSTWQMLGYGTPIYSNQRYTFPRDWPLVMAPPQNDTEKNYTSVLKERNSVGSYRREFTIPDEWKGKQVFIRFDGVDSFFYLWINGQKIGFSKDSRTAAVFNVTKYINDSGANTLAVEVYRYSDGSYLECQDMWRMSGIFRDVSMYATPDVQVRDFFVHTDFPRGYGRCLFSVDVDVRNLGDAQGNVVLKGELLDPQGVKVLDMGKKKVNVAASKEKTVKLSGNVNKPELWNAEKPSLYRLVMTLEGTDGKAIEYVSRKVGLRDVKLVNGVFRLNGKPIKLKGVNRHEHSGKYGHTVSREDGRREIELMKTANINHVRNSHYPQPGWFYDMCDEYGIYVCDEANVESHGYYYGDVSLSHAEEWKTAHVERNKNMVEQSKNNPSVVMWSYGNEAGPGKNFEAVRDWIKQRDSSRVTQYERNNDLADLRSNQYPSVRWAQSTAEKKQEKPWYVSEYAHILCNSMGNLQDYWDAFESSDSIIGGGIWEWIHQSTEQEVKLPDGKKITIQAYGGDFGDYPNDGIFCVKGVIYSDRTPTPIWYDVRKVHQNVSFSWGDDWKVKVKNKNFFTNLNEYSAKWSVWDECGETVAEGDLSVDAAPMSEKTLDLKIKEMEFDADKEYYFNISLHLKQDAAWGKEGYTVAFEQLPIRADRELPLQSSDKPKVKQDGLTFTGDKFTVKLNGKTGAIESYVLDGHSVLVPQKGPVLNAYRAPLANDQWAMRQWFENGLRNLTHEASDIKTEELGDGAVRVEMTVVSRGTVKEEMLDYVSGKGKVVKKGDLTEDSFRFRTTLVYTIFPNGVVGVRAAIKPENGKPILGKLGYLMHLPAEYSHVTWYGMGPYENYPDRRSGTTMNIWNKTVEEMVERYPKPMEMGNRMNTRWVALTNDKGEGLLVAADKEMNFSALPFTPQALTEAAHPYQIKRSGDVVLTVDALTLGLGGASCGPKPMDRDIPYAQPVNFSYFLYPLGKQEKLTDAARRKLPVTPRDEEIFSGNKLEEGSSKFAISYTNSQQPGEGDAANVLDGNPATYWHTVYGVTLHDYPHEIQIDLKGERTVKGMRCLPRQGTESGRVADYEVYVSMDGEKWGEPVAKGRFKNSGDWQKISFDKPVKAKFIRFVALNEVKGGNSAAMAELDIDVEG